MAEKFLYSSDVISGFQQMRGKRMSQRMARRPFDQTCLPNRLLAGLLEDGFVHVMPSLLSGSRIPPAVLLRKHPLPAPFRRCLRVFPVQGLGQRNPSAAVGQILPVNGLDFSQVLLERFL